MTRAAREPRQLPLLPAADMAPRQDPVDNALGVVGADPDAQWTLVMEQYGRMAARAYHRAHSQTQTAD